MAKQVIFSKKNLTFSEINSRYSLLENSLKLYFDTGNYLHIGKTVKELEKEFEQEIEELNMSMSFTLLAAIEAHLRIDCINRCLNRKKKDMVTSSLKIHYSKFGNKIKLKEHILNSWKPVLKSTSIVPNIKDAWNYRDWLAHGRYWSHNLGRKKYDFKYIKLLADEIYNDFTF